MTGEKTITSTRKYTLLNVFKTGLQNQATRWAYISLCGFTGVWQYYTLSQQNLKASMEGVIASTLGLGFLIYSTRIICEKNRDPKVRKKEEDLEARL